MKKILLFIFCLIPFALSAQYKVRGALDLSGYIIFEPASALPSPAGELKVVNFNDTLRINQGGAWKPLMSAISGSYSDTFPNIYVAGVIKFVGGGYIINSGGSGIRIHPNGDAGEYITIIQNEGTGTTIAGVDNISFSSIAGVSSDDMQGFRDDSTSSTNEDKVTLSARAIRQLAKANGGLSGTDPLTLEDSLTLGYEGTADNQLRKVGMTSTGALKAYYESVSAQYQISDTIVSLAGNTGYALAIGRNLAGMNLISVEAYYGNSAGTRVPTINIYRNRGGTEVLMTSAGANFTTDATINTTYDDVIRGDRLKLTWTLSGTGSDAGPYGIYVILTFRKP